MWWESQARCVSEVLVTRPAVLPSEASVEAGVSTMSALVAPHG